MKTPAGILAVLLAFSAQAEVRLFIQDSNGVALLKYECTSGELVRAFALDVWVDRGQIVGVTDFARGPSTASSPGYGIFPTALRDYLLANGGTNVDWNAVGYTPLADVQDDPDDTLPGLNSGGVTLEFGGLWDPAEPGAVPASAGTLCALWLTGAARVCVSANGRRGGVVSVFSANSISPRFLDAIVGPAVTKASGINGVVTISFQDGELQTATSPGGPWNSTSDFSGVHVEFLGTNATRFFRVKGP